MHDDDIRRELLDLSRAVGTLDMPQPDKPPPPRVPVWPAIALDLALGVTALLLLLLVSAPVSQSEPAATTRTHVTPSDNHLPGR